MKEEEEDEESSTQRERRAELTLLAVMENIPDDQKADFLKTHDVPQADYDRICEKYSRILDRFRKDKKEKLQ